MTSKQQKEQLTRDISNQLLGIKIPKEVVPYIKEFIRECSLHQLQNLQNNMSEVKKFITQSI